MQKPGRGLCGWVGNDIRCVYHNALSWLSETWKISIAVRNETTVDAFWDMYNPVGSRRESVGCRPVCIFCVRLLRCPFYCNGQFQGLRKRNGQQVRPSRIFFNFDFGTALQCGSEVLEKN